MSRRLILPAAVAAGLLAAPALAAADVPVSVPHRFLGGPIAAPTPVHERDAARGLAGAGRPSAAPALLGDPCAGAAPGDCLILVGDDAQVDVPVSDVVGGDPGPGPEAPPEDPDTDDPPPPDQTQSALARPSPAPPAVPTGPSLAAAFGGLLAPRPAGWLPWETPVLRWRTSAGARAYNVQVFRGARRVLDARTRRPHLRVPADVLDQGRSYVWVVWPESGSRRHPRFGTPVGRSTFEITLRPRIVFHRVRRGVVGEVRPRIPDGRLRLGAPRALRGAVPRAVRLDGASRFRLAVTKAQAERLRARLMDRGPQPPIGLRGGR